MDELELIRSFHWNDTTPNPVARTAARDRLIAHIGDAHPVAESAGRIRGARLAGAREWATDHAEAARCRGRRLRVLATGLTALTVIVAALAVWVLDERSNAQQQTDNARHQAAEATSLAAASALPRLNSQPDVSLLLALESDYASYYRASPRVEARSGVLAALTAARGPGVLASLHDHTDAVIGVAFSRGGRTLASASDNGKVWLWDVRTRKQLGTPLTGHIGNVYEKRFSERMNSRSAAGFMLTVAQAISDAGTSQPDKIWGALQRRNLPAAATIMPGKGVNFNKNGQNTEARVVLQQIIGGSYVDVYLDDLASRHAGSGR